MYVIFVHICCRAPRGARGLKCRDCLSVDLFNNVSRPARGAWIEIIRHCEADLHERSRPARGAWIEICSTMLSNSCEKSRPARGAWIEIRFGAEGASQSICRAPRGARGLKCSSSPVSGVWFPKSRPARGAWIEIYQPSISVSVIMASRPARGAWIEMARSSTCSTRGPGRAPRGARGLKCHYALSGSLIEKSRPARGAWIEIL